MAAIVGRWLYGWHAGLPDAGRMVGGIAAGAASAAIFLFPPDVPIRTVGLDASSVRHRGQIPGLLLIVRVVAAGACTGPVGRRSQLSPSMWFARTDRG